MDELKIGASTLLVMCAAHFVAGFSSGELNRSFFASDFDAVFGGEPVEISYRIDFEGKRAKRIDVTTFCDLDEVVTGDFQEAKRVSVWLINRFLEGYSAERVGYPRYEWMPETDGSAESQSRTA